MAELKQDVRERAMFGCTWDEFRARVQGGWYDLDDPRDALSVSMSLQSDAQELMALREYDQARQLLNLSKRLLAEVQDVRRQHPEGGCGMKDPKLVALLAERFRNAEPDKGPATFKAKAQARHEQWLDMVALTAFELDQNGYCTQAEFLELVHG